VCQYRLHTNEDPGRERLAARWVRRVSEYGVNIAGSVQVDMSQVKARKDALVAQSRTSLESWLSSVADVRVHRGHARFLGPRTVSVRVGRRPMVRIAWAREKGETEGFMKFILDPDSRTILGAAILGVGGDEAVHSVLDAMYAHLPYTAVQRGVRIHPTVSELIPAVLAQLQSA
jgi:pyruvate/2-oxoglutarate dehydrogenase complex dihydrolipoamide dehydrogenase (E3) component